MWGPDSPRGEEAVPEDTGEGAAGGA
jgi:hypothetical protein